MNSRAHRRVLPFALAAAVCLLRARGACAGVNQWTPLGPFHLGGTVHALALDPSATGVLYAGTEAGVFRTADGGETWASLSVGLLNLSVAALAVDPASPATIYATFSDPFHCGVSKSTDGGASWSSASDGLDGVCPSPIAIDIQHPATLYAASNGDVFRSTDGAAHWSKRGNIGDTGAASIVIDPRNTATLYVASNSGVFKSTDGGATWTSASTGLSGTYFTALALDFSLPARLYAGSDAGIFKTTDGGQSWTSAAIGLPNGPIWNIVIDASLPSLVYASTEAGVYRSADGGATWKAWIVGLGAIPVRALAVAAGPVVYAGTAADSSSSVYARAGEDRWEALNTSFAPARVISVASGSDGSTLFAVSEEGVYRTTDAGVHWTRLADLPDSAHGVAKIVTDPWNPSSLYLAKYFGVYRSLDGGQSWAPSGLQDHAVFSLVADRGSPGTLFAGTSPETGGPGAIWKTTDGGASWAQLGVSLEFGDYPVTFAIDPSNSATVFAGTYSSGILKSTDGGATWRPVNPAYGAVDSIVIDPVEPFRITASSNGTVGILFTPPGRVDYSDDGGETWFVASGLPCCGVAGLVIDPISRELFVGVDTQTFASSDHGATWTPVGASGGPWPSLVVHAPSGFATLYGIGQGGVEAMTVGAGGPCKPDATALCLQDGRFRVEAGWQLSPMGPIHIAQAVPVTSDSGYFWFFDPDNVELMVKVLDGTSVNGFFWVFYGALSNVGYTILVTDTLTGETKTYVNPPGKLASVADIAAFPGFASPFAAPDAQPVAAAPQASALSEECLPDGVTLCLNGGRFRVEAAWQVSPSGPTVQAHAVPLTGDTGYFWFFDDANVELVVKVLDGTAINGHFWVFYGALSNVEYTISVTDTQTGAVKTYHNPRGTLASVADTTAF